MGNRVATCYLSYFSVHKIVVIPVEKNMLKKIDLFIVGAQKCATTSLKNYMSEHPDISGQIQTEMTYFTNNNEFEQGYDSAFIKYFSKDKEDAKVRIAKYVSLCTNETGLQRLKEHNPDCKIIFMIRNPIDRAVSSFAMQKSIGAENRSFDEAIIDILNNKESWQYRAFIKLGFYIEFIKNILNYFDANNIKIVILEEFKENPQTVLSEIFDWINVDNEFIPEYTKVHNQGGNPKSKVYRKLLKMFMNENNIIKRVLKKLLPNQLTSKIGFQLRQLNKDIKNKEIILPNTRVLLNDIYEPYNRELAHFMDREYPVWAVK
ncbi:MAG: sulfotransferase family protein [Nitrososphaeraceae archaeon]